MLVPHELVDYNLVKRLPSLPRCSLVNNKHGFILLAQSSYGLCSLHLFVTMLIGFIDLVAEVGVEPTFGDYEPPLIPFHYSALIK